MVQISLILTQKIVIFTFAVKIFGKRRPRALVRLVDGGIDFLGIVMVVSLMNHMCDCTGSKVFRTLIKGLISVFIIKFAHYS